MSLIFHRIGVIHIPPFIMIMIIDWQSLKKGTTDEVKKDMPMMSIRRHAK